MRSTCRKIVVPAASILLLVAGSGHLIQDPGSDFNSDPARKAASKYTEQVAKLDDEYSSKLRKITEQFAKELDEARKAALAKPDLDEAQRILKAQTAAQAAVVVKPAQRKPFEVITARWGALTEWLDVTTPVRARIKDGQLSLVPDQMNFPDPIDGTREQLVVMFVKDGKFDLAIAGDGQPLTLPPR